MSVEKDILKILRETNTYYENGHYKLESGKHSDTYFQVRLALSFNHIAKKIGKLMADQFRSKKIDKVVGFTVGGNILAAQVAHFLNSKEILGEKKKDTIVFSPGTKFTDRDRILVVDDVLTTEESITPILKAIKDSTKGKIIGVGIIVDRHVKKIKLGTRIASFLRIKPKLWSPKSCPLCKKGIPLTDFSSPNTDSFSIVYSIPDESRNALVKSYKEYYKKVGEHELLDNFNPKYELPGKKHERIAVLGSFDNFQEIEQIAKIVSKFGYYAITSKLIYKKDSGEREAWEPYEYESMNDFLGRMIFSCQYSIIIYNREGGQFIETMWCSQSNKPTLGLVFLRPWSMESKSCRYQIKGPGIIYCDGFEALKSGSKQVGGFICATQKDCPLPDSKLTKMILDIYTTSHTMYLFGTDSSDNAAKIIKNFLDNHGNINLKQLTK